MRSAISAFDYYFRRSAANRARALLAKLRRPRYVIGFLLAAAYLWFFLVRPVESAPRGEGTGRWIRVGVQGFYLLSLVMAWLFGALGRGLVFREAEVELLFAAPLRRSGLLLFKLMQVQFGQLVTALVFTVIVRRSLPERPFLPVLFALWLTGNALYAHQVFANLSLRSLAARGGLMKAMAFLPGVLLVLFLAVSALIAHRDVGGIATPADVERLIEAGPLGVLLAPLRFLADFVLVARGTDWLLAAAVVLGAGAALFGLVVAADHRFEDQALKTASLLGRFKRDGMAALEDPGKLVMKDRRTAFPALARTGPAWRALVWKNVLSVGRLPRATARLIFILIPFLVAGFVFARGAMSEGKAQAAASFMLLVVAAYGSLLGPALLRVDLRLDLLHFDVLKALPIRGRDLLLGEVLGPAVLVFLVQVVLVGLGIFFFPDDLVSWLDWRRKLVGFLIALPFLFAFDFMLFTLENLMALHLPSFVRFGRGMRGGFDQFGQNILGAIVRFLATAIFILPAALIGGGAALLLAYFSAAPIELVLFVGVLLGSVVLAAVAYAFLVLSEPRYERFDLSAESLGVDA